MEAKAFIIFENWSKEKHYLQRMFCQGVLSPAEPQEHCRGETAARAKDFSRNFWKDFSWKVCFDRFEVVDRILYC